MAELAQAALHHLRAEHGINLRQAGRARYRANGQIVNLRTTHGLPNSRRYWFDVTPSFLTDGSVDYFLFVCGSAEDFYTIPSAHLNDLVEDANLAGSKQVPNFNIEVPYHLLVPCGLGQQFDIRRFFRDVTPLRPNQPLQLTSDARES